MLKSNRVTKLVYKSSVQFKIESSRIRTYIRNLEGFRPNPLDDGPYSAKNSKAQMRKLINLLPSLYGRYRDRTSDFLLVRQALSQLS